MRFHRPLLLTLAAVSAVGGSFFLAPKQVHAQGTPYQPGPAKPAPPLPAEFTLSARFPQNPSAALVAHRCTTFDVLRNDLIFSDGNGSAGVRFLKAPSDTRVVVEFAVRVDAAMQFNLKSTIGVTENSPTTSLTVPKGIHRVTVRGVAPKDREGIAQISCGSNATWRVLSVNVRRE